MNKKLILALTVIAAALVTLTAYKTKEQQQQEIAQAIAMKLDEYRIMKQEECTARVNTEARRRFDEYVASLPPAKPSKPGAKPSVTRPKAPAPKAPAVTPMPQTPPQDPQKQRGGAVQEGNVEQQKQRGGAVQEGNAEQQKKRGGAIKVEGGNN
ncbi:MAG: hypothetical protein RMJ33_14125 [Saprospiraceae bacterium]|nr:hypothetical protein [Saprospiraceae bacterium]MDW8230967.1 hypothetical protein [Saprospiraceae bacterium]